MFDTTRAMRALATAALGLLALLPAAQAGCQYKALGTIALRQDEAWPIIDGTANGVPVRVLVDTGADSLAMSGELAQRLHLSLGHLNQEQAGIGGTSEASYTRLARFTLGKFEWTDAPFLVLHQSAKAMPDIIIGARFLLQQDVEMTSKAITFFAPSGCDDTPLAYWAPDVPWVTISAPSAGDPHLHTTVQINGQDVRTIVDSGAMRTSLDLSAAKDLHAELGIAKGTMGGVGSHAVNTWTSRFDSVAVGPEIVHNAHLVVDDMWGSVIKDAHSIAARDWAEQQPQMLLGYDFLRAHRVLFAASQHRMYFSYTGGRIFDAPTQSDAAAPSAAASAAPSASAVASPLPKAAD